MLVGGGACSPGLVRAFRELLDLADGQLVVPGEPQLLGARGAAQMAESAPITTLSDVRRVLEPGDAVTTGAPCHREDAPRHGALPPLTQSSDRTRVRPPEDPAPTDGRFRAYLGIDVGSVSTNLVLLDPDLTLLQGVARGPKMDLIVRMGTEIGVSALIRVVTARSLQDPGPARMHPAGKPLEAHYRKGCEYSDGWVDDARLVVANAIDALERGAEVLTRTACAGLQRDDGQWIATLRATDGRERTLRARLVVYAAGPWVADFLDRCTPTPARHHPRLIRGIHIVVRKLFDHDFAYIFQAPDGRIVFALPYEGDVTLIGTTKSEYTGDLAHPAIVAAEQAYLLEMANRYFQRDLGVGDVVWTFAGLRPLLAASMDDPKSVTRDYVIDFDRSGAPLLSVYGGKLSTYRKLAETEVDMLGFACTESDGYQPYLADLAWPLVTEFLGRELIQPAQ